MSYAIRVHEYGGPEVLKWEKVEVGDPGPGEIKIRQAAVGLNFIDVYQRSGLYPQPSFPFIPGMEGAGVVTALGEGVRDLKVGRHVAYAGPIGAYAEERLIAADRVVKIPAGVDDKIAAAIMLKGMTAQYLLRRTYKVGRDTTLLFHAAAGGVGLIACQWAASLGATVIGTVGSSGKALIARAHGCTHVINIREEDLVAKVKEYTKGNGVDVVYDSIGKDTFPASLDCLKPLGHVGQLRPIVRPGAAVQDHAAVAEGVAVRHPPVDHRLHQIPQGSGGHGQRFVRGDRQGQGQGRRQPDLCARRRGRRATRPRSSPHHGIDGAAGVNSATERRGLVEFSSWLSTSHFDWSKNHCQAQSLTQLAPISAQCKLILPRVIDSVILH